MLQRYPKPRRKPDLSTNGKRHVRSYPPRIQHDQEALLAQYVADLESRMQVSETIATGVDEKGTAALLYDLASQSFIVIQKDLDQETANIYDTISRDQWGGTFLVIGHKRQTGDGFIASGHISIRNSNLRIKFANERFFDCAIDPDTPCLLPFHPPAPPSAKARPQPRAQRGRCELDSQKPKYISDRHRIHDAPDALAKSSDSEADDFTEEDLARLRGEISFESSGKKSHQQKNRQRYQ